MPNTLITNLFTPMTIQDTESLRKLFNPKKASVGRHEAFALPSRLMISLFD